MKVVYQSSDRRIFDTAEACLDHEKNGLLFEMYDMNGDAVTDTSDAALVHLRPNGGEAFIKACQEDDTNYDGIWEDSEGWYHWDEDYHEYQLINMELCRAVAKVNPSFGVS